MRGGGLHPNRPPETFARTPTIPEEVTDVSIYDKGPEPRRVPALWLPMRLSVDSPAG
jgi:hypothetical protein